MVDIEIHFAEGFDGQAVSVEIDGKPVAEFVAQTKLTIGLAHVESMTLPQGKEVAIKIGGQEPRVASFSVDAAKPFIVLTRREEELDVAPTGQRPGYV